MMDQRAATVALFRARMAMVILWHITQVCVWLLARLVLLSGALFLIVVLGISVLEMLACLLGIS